MILWFCDSLPHTNPLVGAPSTLAGAQPCLWHQSWRSIGMAPGWVEGGQCLAVLWNKGREKGLSDRAAPHPQPLQPLSWAAPAVPGRPHCHGASCCCLVPSSRSNGSRSPSSVAGEGNRGCFGVWGLEEARPNQELWISQEKSPPDGIVSASAAPGTATAWLMLDRV